MVFGVTKYSQFNLRSALGIDLQYDDITNNNNQIITLMVSNVVHCWKAKST